MATREVREVPTLLAAPALDGGDAAILAALTPPHVYQPLPALHARSGVPVDDLRRRLCRLERAGDVHRLRTNEPSLQDHSCLSTAGRPAAAAYPGR